jgi:hypothetical protein
MESVVLATDDAAWGRVPPQSVRVGPALEDAEAALLRTREVGAGLRHSDPVVDRHRSVAGVLLGGGRRLRAVLDLVVSLVIMPTSRVPKKSITTASV